MSIVNKSTKCFNQQKVIHDVTMEYTKQETLREHRPPSCPVLGV